LCAGVSSALFLLVGALLCLLFWLVDVVFHSPSPNSINEFAMDCWKWLIDRYK
jgi:hypothetical protein